MKVRHALILAMALVGFSSKIVEGKIFTGELEWRTYHDQEITIKKSPGGSGASATAISNSKKLIIDGMCISACAWAFVISENSCFTKNAKFIFHSSSDPGTGKNMPIATEHWLMQTPEPLSTALSGLMESNKFIRINMSHYLPGRACK